MKSACAWLWGGALLVACSSAPASPGSSFAGSCEQETAHHGEGTYYDADGSGSCSFPATPGDLMVAALNERDYGNAAYCGACARVTGALGTVTVRIVDRCPECQPGDLDLSPRAFDSIDEHRKGRVPIEWTVVPCEVQGPIEYFYKDGANPWWLAVQIRNHRHPIAGVEARATGQSAWRRLERARYNFFLEPSGLGEGPYDFRVTDVYGGVVEDHGVPFSGESTTASGGQQLPLCGGS